MDLFTKEDFYKEKCMEKENTIGVNLVIGTKEVTLTTTEMAKELIINHLASLIVVYGSSVNFK
jgi:hypothetical protein